MIKWTENDLKTEYLSIDKCATEISESNHGNVKKFSLNDAAFVSNSWKGGLLQEGKSTS